MGKSFTLGEFLKTYNSDYDCLKELVNIKYPDGVSCKKCLAITHHYLLKTRPVLSCSKCHSQINPLRGTIFEKTTKMKRSDSDFGELKGQMPNKWIISIQCTKVIL